MKKKLFNVIVISLIVLSLGMIVFSNITNGYVVSGTSMTPYLVDGEELYGWKYIDTKNIKRFDIVVASHNDKKVIKRVIGLPGETIRYSEGKLYVNDQYVEEKFLDENASMCTCGVYSTSSLCIDEITLEDNEFFLMGDNREDSLDSRYYGPFTEDNIVSIAFFVSKSSEGKIRFI